MINMIKLICLDHIKNKKPNPEGILMALNYLNCDPENAIYVGDHQRDIEAGQQAGVKQYKRCIRVHTKIQKI